MSYLKCPGCNKFAEAKVRNIRKAVNLNGLRRRRECTNCGVRYSTVEQIVPEGRRGYPANKPLYFEEDYQDEETDTDNSSSSRFKYRMRRNHNPGPDIS
jgi:Transcriptional repressor NrdR-like, N-terminal domain